VRDEPLRRSSSEGLEEGSSGTIDVAGADGHDTVTRADLTGEEPGAVLDRGRPGDEHSRTEVAECIDDELARHSLDRLLARGIDIGHGDDIGDGERSRELRGEVPGAGVEMGLEEDEQATAVLERVERRCDLGRIPLQPRAERGGDAAQRQAVRVDQRLGIRRDPDLDRARGAAMSRRARVIAALASIVISIAAIASADDAPVTRVNGLEPLVPDLASHPYRLDPGPRPYEHRFSVSPSFGWLAFAPAP